MKVFFIFLFLVIGLELFYSFLMQVCGMGLDYSWTCVKGPGVTMFLAASALVFVVIISVTIKSVQNTCIRSCILALALLVAVTPILILEGFSFLPEKIVHKYYLGTTEESCRAGKPLFGWGQLEPSICKEIGVLETSICNGLEGHLRKERCIDDLAIENSDIDLCRSSSCIYSFVRKEDNPSLCLNMIGGNKEANYCLTNYASLMQDRSVCELLLENGDPWTKEVCIQKVSKTQ